MYEVYKYINVVCSRLLLMGRGMRSDNISGFSINNEIRHHISHIYISHIYIICACDYLIERRFHRCLNCERPIIGIMIKELIIIIISL